MSEKPRGCPFCGGELYRVESFFCHPINGCLIQRAEITVEQIPDWNRRAEPDEAAVERGARALKRASEEVRYGLYDYTAYGSDRPHVVRDGPRAIFKSDDRNAAAQEYSRLMWLHRLKAALAAMEETE